LKGGIIIAIVGIILIAIGAGLASYGYVTPIKSQSTVDNSVSQPLISRVTFTLQATQPPWVLSAQLKQGQVVNGIFGLTNFTSSQGPVFFYIQNETQLVNWGKCSPCAWPTLVNKSSPSTGIYTFSWTAPAAGAYYFTFDPEYYNATVPAYFDANTTNVVPTTITTTSANTNVIYVAIGIAIFGAVLAGVGLVMGSSSSMSPRKDPKSQPSGSAPSGAEPGPR